MDSYRRSGRLSYTDQLPETESEDADAETCVLAAQESRHVHACIETLKEEHRDAIELAFFADMSYKQIGEVVGVPEGTIKTRIYHARRLLMHCLSGKIERRGA